jgi:hypothetical protein
MEMETLINIFFGIVMFFCILGLLGAIGGNTDFDPYSSDDEDKEGKK